ncbi:FAD dependent oxidoreductase, putative [Synechococcus sp. PCC 7335]|uniref:NAD(P)/FAD-dependent oxidoreductase n=1 Tax=Synechococcus sp. (strain ATCC 29403 / PCC 7335) TaxID=91464 RepID=UPI00017EBBF7|nr:FAD-dependent oxidoreductase [Synechococcus sp. PCC 7335]EDX86075.1 FAD dependent oxidoreductase, putative [Synechococcus sp. PCC 7335]
MRPKVVVVGCGVVGAMIAYELSLHVAADIYVIDQHQPAQGSTGAALGVLMGVISRKVKGRTWQLRETSICRYRSLVRELHQQGYPVPFNTQGILSLCFNEDQLPRWHALKKKRAEQGWPLDIWRPGELAEKCPHIELENEFKNESGDRVLQSVAAAIYSPADAQVHPAQLTQALVSASKKRGVRFLFDTEVTGLEIRGTRCNSIQTKNEVIVADWVVLSAGLGAANLSRISAEPLELIPVLGQAMEIELSTEVGDRTFQPVINGDDIQFVPLGGKRYWLGATVEFPEGNLPLSAKANGLKDLQQAAARFCSVIAQANILDTWSGLRPRPVGQPAPVIKPLGDIENVILATGHYRNGVLLAPATAKAVCQHLEAM